VIVAYHSIVPNAVPGDPYALTAQALREHVLWLLDSGFEIVPLSALVERLRPAGSGRGGRRVVLTFDDGYRDFATHAVPVLRDFGLPATVFLVTGLLGKAAAWSAGGSGAALMTEAEVRACVGRGIRLGSHTCTHADLPTLGEEALRRELSDSRRRMEELGEDFFALSYPWGRCGSREAAAAKEAGYHCAVGVCDDADGPGADPYRLRRLVMRGDMDLERFGRLMKGPGLGERLGEGLRRAARLARRAP
jgi:peptidoglycan/xylan/chitin deacetylase (PgdA/CDA1 family)